eukprot:12136006-Alexandrium_andersonii.AAC.1
MANPLPHAPKLMSLEGPKVHEPCQNERHPERWPRMHPPIHLPTEVSTVSRAPQAQAPHNMLPGGVSLTHVNAHLRMSAPRLDDKERSAKHSQHGVPSRTL